MKKEDLSSLFVYLIMLGIALIYGLTVLKNYGGLSGLDNGMYIGFVVLSILAGVVFNALLFEFGHLIGAKLGGYKILSFNVLYFCFYRKEEKLKFKFASYNGLTGETKIAPKKDNKKDSNPFVFSIVPLVLFLVVFAVIVVLFIMFNNSSLANKASNTIRTAYFLLTMGIVGLMVFVYDAFPLKVDAMNDGYRLRLVANPKNREAFNELLRVSAAIENGEKDVEVKTFETITNFTADLNFNKVYLLLEEEKFAEAEPLIDSVVNSKSDVSVNTYIRAKAQKIYIQIMSKEIEEANEYYAKEVPLNERKIIAKDIDMASIRAYILMSGLLDKSASETELALKNVMKAFKKTPKARQATEIKLYNKALKRVIDAHPNWNLEGYLLEVK